MKHTIRLIIQYIYYGISWGCTCFVLNCLAFFAVGGEAALNLIIEDFIRQVFGSVIVGVACCSTAIVYRCERLPFRTKFLIHFAVGMGVFFPTALYLGWIPFHPDQVIVTLCQLVISCGIFVVIWFCFYLLNKREAEEINARLKELEQDRQAEN